MTDILVAHGKIRRTYQVTMKSKIDPLKKSFEEIVKSVAKYAPEKKREVKKKTKKKK